MSQFNEVPTSVRRPRRRLLAGRGRTAHLPLYFAVSLLAATVLDVIGGVFSLAADPEDVGAVATIISAFAKPGVATFVLVGILLFAYLRGGVLDDRAQRERPTPLRARSAATATWAAIIAIVGGVGLATLAIGLGIPLAADLKAHPSPGQPNDITIDLMVAGFVGAFVLFAAVPVWLGIVVLRRRRWARYALIGFCVLTGMLLFAVPALQQIPFFSGAIVVIGLLLIWAELRERTDIGSFRDSWRGVVALACNVPTVMAMVVVQLVAPTAEGAAFAVVFLAIGFILYLVLALLFAMRALNKDVNDFCASLNAMVVVFAPVVVSLVVLVATISSTLGNFAL